MNKNSESEWIGKWISSGFAKVSEEPKFSLADMFSGKKAPIPKPVEERLHAPIVFKKTFDLNKPVKSAKLEITAQGLYQAYLNGKKIGDAIFTPDYTQYQEYLQYQTYSVKELLVKGHNVFTAVVADGWYAGRVAVSGASCQYGNQLALLADLTIVYTDNSKVKIGTDETFSVGTGKWKYSDIVIGEKQDLRIKNKLTDVDPFPEKARVIDADYHRLSSQYGPQVKKMQTLTVKKIWQEGNKLIADFGQVIAGRIRLTANFKKGADIKIEHSEALDQNGHFFKNIIGRNKDQEDHIIGSGDLATFEPDFTFHGFRYIRITNLNQVDIKELTAIIIFSDMKRTGEVSTSNKRINRLLQNIKWSERGNMLSIPTDCPQRERVGWTGDMQIFAPASTFYYDTESLICRWLKNVRIDQQKDGEIIDYSPAPEDFYQSTLDFKGTLSSAGWGDAIVMVPWTLYQRYGHKEVLKENYQAMKRWHNYSVRSAATDKKGNDRFIWDTTFHYGDWMFPSMMIRNPNPMKSAEVTKDLVATAFLAHTSELLAKISSVLGEEGNDYIEYANKVKKAFAEKFVKEGKLTSDYQGCYVLALAFEMVADNKVKKQLLKRLVQLIHNNNDCLDTGFLSVPYLLDVLVDNEQVDLAKKLFLQDKCPSWLYEVDHGATTIWESWAGIQPDNKVGTFSFNHYAMGCILDWFIREVVGLNVVKPGFKEVKIAPKFKNLVNDFKMKFLSENGLFLIKLKDGKYEFTIPEGCTATVYPPNSSQFLKDYPEAQAKNSGIFINSGTYHWHY